jgi:hypothetical protein
MERLRHRILTSTRTNGILALVTSNKLGRCFRDVLGSLGFRCFARSDVMDLSNKGRLATWIVHIIKAVTVLRWFAHMATVGNHNTCSERAYMILDEVRELSIRTQVGQATVVQSK